MVFDLIKLCVMWLSDSFFDSISMHMNGCMCIYACAGLLWSVVCAVWAAYRRTLELGNEDSNVGPGRSKH